MPMKHSPGSVSRIVGRYEVSSDEADVRETTFWSAVADYLIESFALYAASIHPAALYPAEPRPDERNILQPSEVFRRERRVRLTLVSTTTSSAGPEPATIPTRSAENAIGFDGDRQREREIERAVAALAELDDRTLRELGIPHRSQIEQTVRYCHDC
jgi:uncharacterized protein YjiS (DUF1127 family)